MKTERRHELQTNTLATNLANWIDTVRPYSRAILAVAVAAGVLLFAWYYLSAQSGRRAADGWNEYFTAMGGRDPVDALNDVSERYAGSMVGEWATISLADVELDDGTNRLLITKIDGRDRLNDAVRRYQALLVETRQPLIRQRATYGLARAYEALGELTKARDEYQKIAKEWPGCAYVDAAEARAAALDKLTTKEFYDWMAKYERPQMQPGQGIADPNVQKALEEGGLKIPNLQEKSLLPKDGAPAGEPATGGETPAADAPAEPKATEPAATETPAEPKATEPPAEPK